MATGPITSWQMEEEKVEAGQIFVFLHFKITTDDDYSHEIKRHLLLGRKVKVLVSWLQLLSTVTLEPKKVKFVTASTFPPSICHEVMGPDVIIFIF